MAYFLVMGSLALSVVFSLGWVLVRSGQWLSSRLSGGGKAKRTRRPARRTTAKTPARAPSTRARAGGATRSATQDKLRREPWPLTRWLAAWRFVLPLSLLTALLFGFTRLAEYGMAARPHDVPGAYHELVLFLGWSTAVLAGLAVIQQFASWRCRRS